MFVKELTRIKESESEADRLQKEAKIQSKQILGNAQDKANELIEKAEENAKTTYDSLLREGQSVSDEQYATCIENIKAECQQMIAAAKKNEGKAVNLIAERIVSASVNC